MKANRLMRVLLVVSCVVHPFTAANASEVITKTNTDVRVREHPTTGRPYVSIVSAEAPDQNDPFHGAAKSFSRPDYRMLDHRVKPDELSYDGVASDRTKVYVFATALATMGTLAGVVTPLAATAGTASAGGAGTYAAASTAVTVGAVSRALSASRPDPGRADFTQAYGTESALSELGPDLTDSSDLQLDHVPKKFEIE